MQNNVEIEQIYQDLEHLYRERARREVYGDYTYDETDIYAEDQQIDQLLQ